MVINATAPLLANVTLTHFTPLAANITLTQAWWIPWLNVGGIVIGAVVGAGAGIISSYLTRTSEERLEKEKLKNITIQKQWEVYSRLKGIQVRISHDIAHLYHFRVGLVGVERNIRIVEETEVKGILREEGRELISNSRDISNKLAEHRQNLHEIIALVIVLFPNDPELYQKIEPIDSWFSIFEPRYKKSELRKEAERISSAKEIDEWRDGKFEEISSLVTEKVKAPLDDLSNYLKDKLSVD